MSAKALSAADAANEIETADNDIRRAVSTWTDCDVAAIVPDGGNIGPATQLGDVVEINDLDATDYILIKVNLR